MTEILKSYQNLSSSSSRATVNGVLDSVINALPFVFNASTRTELIQLILRDLEATGSKGRLTSKEAARALLAVKSLAKVPEGSEVLAQSSNLSKLLAFVSTYKDDADASNEALRCIANCLLLVESARSTLISLGVQGGDVCLRLLEKSTAPDQIFILARILFLATAAGTNVQTIVEGKTNGRAVVDIIGSKLDLLSSTIPNNTPFAREAATDLLKFTFNLLLYYPKLVESDPQTTEIEGEKVMGDFWNPRLNGILPPLLRLYMSVPPTPPCPVAAPLTHVIHSLITIPVNDGLRSIWLNLASTNPPSRNSVASTPGAHTPNLNDSPASPTLDGSPTRPSTSATLKPSAIDRALSVLAAGRKSLSRSTSPSLAYTGDVIQRTYDLLDLAFKHYFSGNLDVDDVSIRERAKAESSDSLDDMLTPLVVLLTRFCIADEPSRLRVRQWIVPDGLDRSSPLEQRSDILGRCLRLMGSVYHPRLKDAVGEMLYALSDQDPSSLSALVGYGNVAGFLFHKGVLSGPPQTWSSNAGPSLTTPSGDAINPITGTTVQPKSELPEMSEEEKEREMDKLFVLFDRLEKNGAITAEQNPIRKAIQEGKMG